MNTNHQTNEYETIAFQRRLLAAVIKNPNRKVDEMLKDFSNSEKLQAIMLFDNIGWPDQKGDCADHADFLNINDKPLFEYCITMTDQKILYDMLYGYEELCHDWMIQSIVDFLIRKSSYICTDCIERLDNIFATALRKTLSQLDDVNEECVSCQ